MSTVSELKNQVKTRLSISEVIGRFVKLKRSGINMVACCPFHDERSPSFTVNDVKGIYKCFGCGASGDSVEFVMKHEKLDFIPALQMIAKNANMPADLQLGTDGSSRHGNGQPKSTGPAKFVDKVILEATLASYDKNPLYLWMASIFGASAAIQLCLQFYVGTAKQQGTIYWQVDQFKRIRTAQKIHYGPDGHRIKSIPPKRLFLTDHGYAPCLFGEHQLMQVEPGWLVCLVESEKTAMICTALLPDLGHRKCIWLACSGSNGMTDEKIWVLKGLDVCLVPDFSFVAMATWGILPMRKKIVNGKTKICEDGEDDPEYVSVAMRLAKLGCKVTSYLPAPDDRSGRDIADLLVSVRQSEQPPVLNMPDLSLYSLPDEPFG